MSRSGYVDDCDDPLELGRWRGRVASAIRGRRGQAFLRELRDALDAMPEKQLIADELQTEDGEVCAIGCLGAARGIDMSNLDPEDSDQVAATFGIAEVLAKEIVYENDESWPRESPQERWARMRKWVDRNIRHAPPTPRDPAPRPRKPMVMVMIRERRPKRIDDRTSDEAGTTRALTQTEVGELLGVTRNRISQIELRAIAKIREFVKAEAAAQGMSVRDWLFAEVP